MRKFLRDLFTAPDGKTWALPRFYSIPVMLTGLGAPWYSIYKGQPISMADLALLLPGVAGAVLLLIRGANNIDDDLPPHPPVKEPTP